MTLIGESRLERHVLERRACITQPTYGPFDAPASQVLTRADAKARAECAREIDRMNICNAREFFMRTFSAKPS